jgi:hypothetical protein
LAALCGSLVIAAPRKKPPPPPKPLPTLTVCGTLVEGVECTLLEGDNGGLYIVNTAGFPVGSCICVTGPYDAFCNSYCQQGDGCIYNTTATACP